ncbi:MAG TPA: hypothetical protein VIG33_17955 [Pseudobdellovibrionaceae bacterium]|jgi:hypothetical protein
MKRYVLAAFTFCLIIGFQNCSPHQFTDVNNSNALSNPAEVTPAEKVDVSQTEIVEIPESPYLESLLQSDIIAINPTSTFASHHLTINVKTGVVHVMDQNNETLAGIQYCLSSSDVNELQTILTSSKLCENQAIIDEQTNCTANYQFPYARLQVLDTKISLGESTSGCHKGPDLCGEQRDLLQGLIAHIQGDLASKKCEFQVVQQQ